MHDVRKYLIVCHVTLVYFLNGSYDFSTFHQICPFLIRFRAFNDINYLDVVALQIDHNRDVSKVH